MHKKRLLFFQGSGSLPPNNSQNKIVFIGKVMIQLTFSNRSSLTNVIEAGVNGSLFCNQERSLGKNTLTTITAS